MASKKPSTNKQLNKAAQTPFAFVVTGLVMWLIAYVLVSLAIDSGSLLQWAGSIIALVWGSARIVQGIRHKLK